MRTRAGHKGWPGNPCSWPWLQAGGKATVDEGRLQDWVIPVRQLPRGAGRERLSEFAKQLLGLYVVL